MAVQAAPDWRTSRESYSHNALTAPEIPNHVKKGKKEREKGGCERKGGKGNGENFEKAVSD